MQKKTIELLTEQLIVFDKLLKAEQDHYDKLSTDELIRKYSGTGKTGREKIDEYTRKMALINACINWLMDTQGGKKR